MLPNVKEVSRLRVLSLNIEGCVRDNAAPLLLPFECTDDTFFSIIKINITDRIEEGVRGEKSV